METRATMLPVSPLRKPSHLSGHLLPQGLCLEAFGNVESSGSEMLIKVLVTRFTPVVDMGGLETPHSWTEPRSPGSFSDFMEVDKVHRRISRIPRRV